MSDDELDPEKLEWYLATLRPGVLESESIPTQVPISGNINPFVKVVFAMQVDVGMADSPNPDIMPILV